jgi:purine-nucleoside phosphorylase
MTKTLNHKSDKAANFIKMNFEKHRFDPKFFVVLGSGFKSVAQDWPILQSIKFSEIPFFPIPGVKGHGEELLLARPVVNNRSIDVVIATGRVHLYENFTPQEVCFSVEVASKLNIKSIVLTNASGGITQQAEPGTIMLISDHINLSGQNFTATSTKGGAIQFTDMTCAYNKEWQDFLHRQFNLPRGVYAGLLGPTFETPAEAKMLLTIGADLAGMSTVQETIAARSLGMNVLGLSFVTNKSGQISNHTDVLRLIEQKASSIRSILEASICFNLDKPV